LAVLIPAFVFVTEYRDMLRRLTEREG
jgi:hypothetical protein